MKYAISILTYSAVEHSKRCIASVISNSNMDNVRLILTANGNKEALNHFNLVKEKYPSTIVVWNEVNEGFIKPNNHALTLCEEEFFILLNDDVVIAQKDWLEVLAKPFTEFKDAALVGPGGGCQSLLPNFHGTMSKAFEYLEGSVLMCKTSLLKKHGLFPDWLEFAYGEDSHLSLRMRELGYTLHKRPFQYSHAKCQTSKTVPEVRMHETKNHEKLRKRWEHYMKVRRMDYPIVVSRNGALGDVLLVTPILRRIKQERPMSQIFVRTACPAVLSGNTVVSSILGNSANPDGALIVDLNMSYENMQNTHYIDAYAKRLFDATGIDGVKRELEFYISEKDRRFGEKFKGYTAIHVGPTTWPSRNWCRDKWQPLIDMIGGNIVIVGHADGSKLERCVDMRGRTTVHQMGGVLSHCKCLITIDSLPLHVAQAVGCPVVGIFGVSDPQYVFTDTSKCIGVHSDAETFGLRHRETGKCLVDDGRKAISIVQPAEVFEAYQSLCLT